MIRFFKRATLVLVGFILALGALVMYYQRNSYIQFYPTGVFSQARTYVNAKGHKVVLIGMAHIALPEFYAEIQKDYSNFFALKEGVSDQKGLLPKNSGYKGFAKSIGLAAQDKTMFPHGIRADSDFSELPSNVVLEIQSSVDFFSLFDDQLSEIDKKEKLKLFSEKFKSESDLPISKDIIITYRNEVMLKYFKENDTKDLVIPWGEEHMAEIEAYVKNNGYYLQSVKKYRLANYSHLARAIYILGSLLIEMEKE